MTAGEPETLDEKYSRLISLLEDSESAVLAFSGGADSSLLLRAMKNANMRMLAVTGSSETVPAAELRQAVEFAEAEGVDHIVLRTDEMKDEAFVSNPPDRCFFCKQELFRKISRLAMEEGYCHVFDGSNADDIKDYRPGLKAAEEFRVRSPLAESGLSKADIRLLSKELGLGTWDKPSAPCLSSRFPYGQRITGPLLRQVENAEDFLRTIGLKTVRVRIHNDIARIEVPGKDMQLLLDNRQTVSEALKSFGFRFVSLDLEGFRSGSLNRVLSDDLISRDRR